MQTAFAVAFDSTKRTSQLTFEGAMLPNKPPIDKIAAYEVVGMSCAKRLDSITFHDKNELSDKEIQEWEKDGILPIDVGSRKYHGQVGSATEWVVKRYCLPRTAGVEKLIELINHNNQTGALKSAAFSVPSLLRKFYELKDGEVWYGEVVWAAADVVGAFVKVANGDIVRKDEPMEGSVRLLAQEFAQDSNKPLTLGQYIKNLWLLGETPDAIVEKLAFWQNGRRELKAAEEFAKREWAKAKDSRSFMKNAEFNAGAHRGIILRSDNRALVNMVTREGTYAIRLIVDSDGHTVIATNKLDLSRLHKELDKREPKQWHYNENLGALINGGPQYTGVRPTRIPTTELVEKLKALFAKK